MKSLQDRVAVVTGSSRGIGAAIAEIFAAEGARLVVHGRDTEALEHVRATIAEAGGEVMAATADLTDLDQIEALRERAESQWGPVDVVVANAGGSPVRPGPAEGLAVAEAALYLAGDASAWVSGIVLDVAGGSVL